MRLEELARGIAETEVLYWDDAYLKVFEANIVRLEPDEKKHFYAILDRTAFHPKSGGQPSDRGIIQGEGFKIEVKKAMLAGSIIVHWGKLLEGSPNAGKVKGEIDWVWRYLLMRRHTAGHLLDHCLAIVTGKRVETTDSWLGDECYVGYKGEPPSIEHSKKVEELENRLIEQCASVKVETISYEDLKERAPEAPNIYRLPMLESFRIVTIEGCEPIPCGGTHIKNISEIRRFTLKNVVRTDLGFNVYYDVQ